MANREEPVLVIGAAGRQGSAVVRELLGPGCQPDAAPWRGSRLVFPPARATAPTELAAMSQAESG